MRIGRVIGTVILGPRVPALQKGRLLLVEPLSIDRLKAGCEPPEGTVEVESLVVFDDLGAGKGQVIAISEGREACVPFEPERVPIDAYAAAILDTVDIAG